MSRKFIRITMQDGSESFSILDGSTSVVTYEAFMALWESINGDTWRKNPWVFAIEFKRVHP